MKSSVRAWLPERALSKHLSNPHPTRRLMVVMTVDAAPIFYRLGTWPSPTLI